jgi:2-oxoisovalerate dehydrogenase E1 component
MRVPVGGYIHGGPYHSQNVESIFAHTPGYLIAMPSTAADAKGLLKAAIRSEDPVLFLEHKALYRQPAARSPEPSDAYELPFGKARTVLEGSDLTIVTYGAIVYKVLSVARQLADEGISVHVIDLRTIYPLDMEAIVSSIQRTNRALVVYEDQRFMGFGAEISAQIMERAFMVLDAPVGRIGARHTPVPFAISLEEAMLPSDSDILRAAKEVVEF